jgi:hypothetical protein
MRAKKIRDVQNEQFVNSPSGLIREPDGRTLNMRAPLDGLQVRRDVRGMDCAPSLMGEWGAARD